MSSRTSATRLTIMASVLLAASLSGCLGFLDGDDVVVSSFDDAFALHGEVYEADGADNGTVKLKLIEPHVHEGFGAGVHDVQVLLFSNGTGVLDANVTAVAEGLSDNMTTAAQADLAHTDFGIYEGTLDATGIDDLTLAFDVTLADATELTFTISQKAHAEDEPADGGDGDNNTTAGGGSDGGAGDNNTTTGDDSTAGNNTTAGPEPFTDSWNGVANEVSGGHENSKDYAVEHPNATINITLTLTAGEELATLKIRLLDADAQGAKVAESEDSVGMASGKTSVSLERPVALDKSYTVQIVGRGYNSAYDVDVVISYGPAETDGSAE